MTAAIFLSYRRRESLVEARAVYERLRAEFGAGSVFIDLEGLDYGVDFAEVLEEQLAHCAVMLALVGPNWLGITAGSKIRRIDDENDFVRIEIRTALERKIRVVPVLVNGAPLPDSAGLPTDLQPLLRRHALELDFRRFDADVGRLVGALRRVPGLSESVLSPHPKKNEAQEPRTNDSAVKPSAASPPAPARAATQRDPTAPDSSGKQPLRAHDDLQNPASSDKQSELGTNVPKPPRTQLADFLEEIAGHPDPTISHLRKGLLVGALVAAVITLLAVLLTSGGTTPSQ